MSIVFISRSKHNHLRISRIIKSLGELGYERFQMPWVEFIFREIFKKSELPSLKFSSCLSYWLLALNDEGEKGHLYQKYGRYLSFSVASVENIGEWKVDSEGSDDEGPVKDNANAELEKDSQKYDLLNYVWATCLVVIVVKVHDDRGVIE